jgi:hypothetical protein
VAAATLEAISWRRRSPDGYTLLFTAPGPLTVNQEASALVG